MSMTEVVEVVEVVDVEVDGVGVAGEVEDGVIEGNPLFGFVKRAERPDGASDVFNNLFPPPIAVMWDLVKGVDNIAEDETERCKF